VCREPPQQPHLVLCCAVVVCKACIDEGYRRMGRWLCPECCRTFDPGTLMPLAAALAADAPPSPSVPATGRAAGPGRPAASSAAAFELAASLPSTKLAALLRELRAVQQLNAAAGAERDATRLTAAKALGLDPVVGDAPLKALVFSQWTSMLDRVHRACDDEGVRVARLDGSMSQAAREAALQRFRTDDGVNVLIMSLKAGGLGLTLNEASLVYLLEPWWNPAVEEQAVNRVHRVGQTRPVLIKRYVCRDTVEPAVMRLQARKRALAAQALAASSPDALAAAHRLSLDDLLSLLPRGRRGARSDDAAARPLPGALLRVADGEEDGEGGAGAVVDLDFD
jgi:hypothetical protein